MHQERNPLPHRQRYDVVGVLLIVLGILFLGSQWFTFSLGQHYWPLFILVPGISVLALGLFTNDHDGGPLIPLGSIVTTIGAILLFQTITDLWATWAYIWALLPASVGAGLVLHGAFHQNSATVQRGTSLLTTGIVMFVLGALFFELFLNLSGFGINQGWGPAVWPVVLIGIGAFLLIRNLIQQETP